MVQALKARYPDISYLQQRARQRIPRFAFDYLSGGCNQETTLRRNRTELDAVCLRTDYLTPYQTPELKTELFGQTYNLPFGIAPLGLSGLIWPQASLLQGRVARQQNIPFVLSTVSTTSIEDAAAQAGENFWFQLYPPADKAIRADLLQRAEAAGCKHLVITVDVPVPGQRPKDIRSGLAVPPKITPRNILQSALRPAWSLATLQSGLPQFATLKPYLKDINKMADVAQFIRHTLREPVDGIMLKQLRDDWPHKLIIKGINHVADAQRAAELGADGIIVSNHGGRQMDAAQATITTLPPISQAVGDQLVIMADSGVESGVDVARFLAAGAQLVFAGRAFMYGVAAHGEQGVMHTADLLQEELAQVMAQLHCMHPAKLNAHQL